jgi:uncharacterized protein YlxW (UPF0749 family)
MAKSKKFTDRTAQIIILLISGIVLGALVITQAKYFTNYVSSVGRDSSENVFRKIQILKTSNDELKDEIKTLDKQFEEISTQASALASINKEIEKNKLIAGEADVYGSGIELTVANEISGLWFTDIVNELFASGAEAVSVNNVRLTDATIGFDTLPNGQIMLNGVILNSPYTFSAIGESSTLKGALESPFGIIEKMKASVKDFEFELLVPDRIDMKKV